MIEPRLPDWVEARWWLSPEELIALAPEAEIGWFDMHDKPPMLEAVELAKGLKWLNSVYAGLDFLPLRKLKQRGGRPIGNRLVRQARQAADARSGRAGEGPQMAQLGLCRARLPAAAEAQAARRAADRKSAGSTGTTGRRCSKR